MGLGLYIYMVWFGVVSASLVIAVIHLIRKRFKGVGLALAAPAGALLSWALVSAYIGVCEIDGYVGSKAFANSLIVGIAGLTLFVLSCTRLKRTAGNPVQTTSEGAPDG